MPSKTSLKISAMFEVAHAVALVGYVEYEFSGFSNSTSFTSMNFPDTGGTLRELAKD